MRTFMFISIRIYTHACMHRRGTWGRNIHVHTYIHTYIHTYSKKKIHTDTPHDTYILEWYIYIYACKYNDAYEHKCVHHKCIRRYDHVNITAAWTGIWREICTPDMKRGAKFVIMWLFHHLHHHPHQIWTLAWREICADCAVLVSRRWKQARSVCVHMHVCIMYAYAYVCMYAWTG